MSSLHLLCLSVCRFSRALSRLFVLVSLRRYRVSVLVCVVVRASLAPVARVVVVRLVVSPVQLVLHLLESVLVAVVVVLVLVPVPFITCASVLPQLSLVAAKLNFVLSVAFTPLSALVTFRVHRLLQVFGTVPLVLRRCRRVLPNSPTAFTSPLPFQTKNSGRTPVVTFVIRSVLPTKPRYLPRPVSQVPLHLPPPHRRFLA